MTRPNFEQLKSRIHADFVGIAAVLREIFAVVWAKALHVLYGYVEWVDEQGSPLTCTLERLSDWASLYAVARLDAVAATGLITGIGNTDAVVLKDAILKSDVGLDYIVLVAVTLVDGTAQVSVRCTTAGTEGNLPAGATLTLVQPLAGIASGMLVSAGGITGGAAQENVENWRLRVVDEWQVVVNRGARSGKSGDYRAWAKNAHPAVSGALVQPHVLGIGTVLVRLICNGLPNRQPTAAIIAAVQAYYADIAPATADWRVDYPLTHALLVDININDEVDTTENRAAIDAAITTLVMSEMRENAVLQMAELDAAIASVTTQYVRLAPVADIAVNAGEVLVLSGVNYS